ncbi:bifunctional 5,10-methylene-tetrahydrofolate dehydrogenase/5,10-methylene-tetrahydrofolate cyclohydrolase [Planctomycetales bacterium ZRK34]|nr:bifunctional 5,10-methylene-tetrahydrofolate dehydrogenase/5,10-methylene-tetrahydrofolate cyclohydrolase [Planctomycetales bacterium ZRK34]
MTTDTSKLIDGKAVAAKVLERCAAKVEKIKQATGKTPCLATVLVGDDPASETYVRMKGKRCEAVGMQSLRVEMSAETTTEQLLEKMNQLAIDAAVNGILLQHPVPSQIDERAAFEAIPVSKDVDGVTAGGLGEMWLGIERFGSCTPAGIMTLLREYNVKLEGLEACVIGRSPILGKPMAAMLCNANATVTICHSRTKDLGDVVRRADLIVAAVGRPNFVKGDWVKEGAIVIDAGYNPGNVGDVDFAAAEPRASLITPVPGGVGPMTIATLIDQTADAAAEQFGVSLD